MGLAALGIEINETGAEEYVCPDLNIFDNPTVDHNGFSINTANSYPLFVI